MRAHFRPFFVSAGRLSLTQLNAAVSVKLSESSEFNSLRYAEPVRVSKFGRSGAAASDRTLRFSMILLSMRAARRFRNRRLQARLGFGHPLARTQMVQPRLEQKGLAQHAFLVKWAVQAPAERAVAQVTLAQRCDEPTEFGRPRRPARRRARRGGRWVASRRSDQRNGGRPGDSVVKPDRREQAAPQRRERLRRQNGRSVGARLLHAASSGRYSNKIERC